jgi:hypothetical protein
MSQENVERVIGRLVTDEAFRRRFSAHPSSALRDLTEGGMALTECELRALSTLEPEEIDSFADNLDPRILKSDLCGGEP